jgi:hypothetical protein
MHATWIDRNPRHRRQPFELEEAWRDYEGRQVHRHRGRVSGSMQQCTHAGRWGRLLCACRLIWLLTLGFTGS